MHLAGLHFTGEQRRCKCLICIQVTILHCYAWCWDAAVPLLVCTRSSRLLLRLLFIPLFFGCFICHFALLKLCLWHLLQGKDPGRN